MPLLFSYGTLQQKDVQISTFGRPLDGQRDALARYAAAFAPAGHKNVLFNGHDDSRVEGTVLDVTDAELARSDAFEKQFAYGRTRVTLASGREAWVYIHEPMRHDLNNTIALLSRTPAVLGALLRGLPETWTMSNEGEGTWTPFDVVGHLIHADVTDWLPRARMILEHGDSRPFEAFDRLGQVRESAGKTLDQLLDRFASVRAGNLDALRALNLQPEHLARTGRHPSLGTVTLSQLLATWAAHDLTHIHQLSRVMAHQYRDAAGPWTVYLGVMQCSGHSA
jgi:gamma-glutamylcyclotransferase (GGCT)/AIG2-like uncharacterized protein YtfP